MVSRYIFIIVLFVASLSAFAPVKNKFTAVEQQEIYVKTPGLFSRSDAFQLDLSVLRKGDYCFPLDKWRASVVDATLLEMTSDTGEEVKAMFDGVVRLSRHVDGMGNVIVLRHRNGLETVYAGNSQNKVDVGCGVKAGRTIATIGERDGKGVCSFFIMVNGVPIDPKIIFNVGNGALCRTTILCKLTGNGIDVEADRTPSSVVDEDVFNVNPFANKPTIKLDLSKIDDGTWAYPLPGGKLISPYGGKRRHSGIDLKTKPNDEIVAAYGGIVTRSSPYYAYGNCIVIKHPFGFETLYSHQSKNLVKVGDKVKAGQVIGLTGRTGRATTEHLHFEVIFKGKKINPTIFLDCRNRTLKDVTITLNKNGRISSHKN